MDKYGVDPHLQQTRLGRLIPFKEIALRVSDAEPVAIVVWPHIRHRVEVSSVGPGILSGTRKRCGEDIALAILIGYL